MLSYCVGAAPDPSGRATAIEASEGGEFWSVPDLDTATASTADSVYLSLPDFPKLIDSHYRAAYLEYCTGGLTLVGGANESYGYQSPEGVFAKILLTTEPELVSSIVAIDGGTLVVSPTDDADGDINKAIEATLAKLTEVQRDTVGGDRIEVGDPQRVSFATKCEAYLTAYVWWVASISLSDLGYLEPMRGAGPIDPTTGRVSVGHEPFTPAWQAEFEKLRERYPGIIEEHVTEPEAPELAYRPLPPPGVAFPEVRFE